MDKNQRISTISVFMVVLTFSFFAIAYALVKGPGEGYVSLEEPSCASDDLACVESQTSKTNPITGFYTPQSIAKYVDVPGISGKLFGFNKGSSLGVTSFVPSGATTLALLSTPIITGGGNSDNDNGNNGQTKQIVSQQTTVCDDGESLCNGECIPENAICEEKGEQDECDSREGECIQTFTTIPPDPQAVPEPATMLLFGTGLAGAALRKRFQA